MKKLVILYLGLFITACLYSQTNWDVFAENMEAWADELESRLGDLENRIELKVKNGTSPVWLLQARLGVQTVHLKPDKVARLGLPNPYGSRVERVIADSPAERAGIQPFDYLVGIDGVMVDSTQRFEDLLAKYHQGDEVTIHLYRQGRLLDVTVRLSGQDEWTWILRPSMRVVLGVSPALQERADDLDGVAVRVRRGSLAEELGLQDGDVIVAVNGFPILDWEDLRLALTTLSQGDEIEVEYIRGGERRTASARARAMVPDMRFGLPEIEIEADVPDGLELPPLPPLPPLLDEEDIDVEWDDEGQAARAFIGVHISKVSKEKARKLGFDNPYGAYVTAVVPRSPAEKAGIQLFDYIYGVDEFRVGEEQSLSDIMRRYKPGDEVTLHIIRKSKPIQVRLTLSEPIRAEIQEPEDDCQDPFLGIFQDESQPASEGVRIKVVEGSTAQDSGIQDGDVIIGIDGWKMVDWDDVTRAINARKPGDPIEVEWLRNGKVMKASKPIKSLAETRNCEDCDCGGDEIVEIRIDDFSDFTKYFKEKMREEQKRKSNARQADKLSIEVLDPEPEELDWLWSKGLLKSKDAGSVPVKNIRLQTGTEPGTIDLRFELTTTADLRIELFDRKGWKLFVAELVSFTGEVNEQLIIPPDAPAQYFLVISTKNGRLVKKIRVTAEGNW